MLHKTLPAATFPYSSPSEIQYCCQQLWVATEARSLQKQSIYSIAEGMRRKKKSTLFGILVPKSRDTRKAAIVTPFSSSSGLKCAHFDPFVSTHSSWGQGGIYATAFELQANIMGTSMHRATTSMLGILPSPERILLQHQTRNGKRMNRKTERGTTSVKTHERFGVDSLHWGYYTGMCRN